MLRLSQAWSLLVLLLFPFVFMRLRTFPRGSAVRRALAWLCLAVALAGPEVAGRGGPETVVVALDLSASAYPSVARALGRLRELVGPALGGAPAGVVVFGERAYVVRAPGPGADRRDLGDVVARAVTAPGDTLQGPEREGTDIGAALGLAGSLLPAGRAGRVILVTDGRQTRGDALAAARDLGRRGVAVDVVPVASPPAGVSDAAVDAVEAPAQVSRGVPVEIRALIRSTTAAPAIVSLTHEGAVVARQEVRLARSEATPVRFSVTPGAAGEYRYGVLVSMEGDDEARNDVAHASITVRGRPRILWIGGDAPAVSPATLDMEQARPAASGAAFKRLASFDAVVLADVEAAALPAVAPEEIRHYVERLGGGLLMLGGLHSFGPGGYRGTPLERVLPVDLDPSSRRRQQGLALVLALDKSGSMAEAFSGTTKIAAAREAAVIAAGLLDLGDRFGLVAFDTQAAPIVPLGAPVSRPVLEETLGRLRASGGTRILPALAHAARMMPPATGWRRHIVLLTDGHGEGGDFEGHAHGLAAAGTTLSVIAIGDDADVARLRTLAASGGGRFELARDTPRLAAALRRETVLARGPVVHEGRTTVLAIPHPVLGDLTGAPIPPLFGYVSTAPKPFAAVAMRAEAGDPILALAAAGLGRTAALTTDPHGAWGRAWREWPRTPDLLGRVLHWVLRAPVAARVLIGHEAAGEGWALTVAVEDEDGNHLNGRTLVARIQGDEGTETTVPLEQRGPGAYAGPLMAIPSKPAMVILEDLGEGAPRVAGRGWIGLSYPAEYRLAATDEDLLRRVGAASAGRWLADPAVGPTLRRTEPWSLRLGPWLLTAALVLFLVELMPEAWRPRPARLREFAARRVRQVPRT